MRAPIASLTGLRFAAALCVVVSHAVPKIASYADPPEVVVLLSNLSGAGMTLFFVLSGFVIYYNYAETIGSAGGLYRFFVARFARLYPLYAFGVSYDLLMHLSYSQIDSGSLAALPYYVTLTQAWVYRPIGEHALIYQFGSVPQVAWSVSTEWFFYLAFPLVCIGITTLRTIRACLLAALALSTAALGVSASAVANMNQLLTYGLNTYGPIGTDAQDSFYRWLVYFSPYARIWEFLLGCICAAIYLKLRSRPSSAEERLGGWLTGFCLAGLAGLHWLMFGLHSQAPLVTIIRGLHMNYGFAPLVAVLIFCCARYRNPVARLMAAPTLLLCGEASYSLYLLHLPVIDAFGYQAPTIHSVRSAIAAAVQLIFVLAAAIGLALVSWAVIEVPARRWLRQTLAPAPAPIAPPQPAAPSR